MARHRSAATALERREEREFAHKMHRLDVVANLTGKLIRYGGMVVIAYLGYKSLAVLAGKYTEANIVLSLLGRLHANEWVAWIFGGSSVIYGWRQRRLRRDEIESLGGRNRKLELKLDKGRTSSRLTRRGDTRPEDLP